MGFNKDTLTFSFQEDDYFITSGVLNKLLEIHFPILYINQFNYELVNSQNNEYRIEIDLKNYPNNSIIEIYKNTDFYNLKNNNSLCSFVIHCGINQQIDFISIRYNKNNIYINETYNKYDNCISINSNLYNNNIFDCYNYNISYSPGINLYYIENYNCRNYLPDGKVTVPFIDVNKSNYDFIGEYQNKLNSEIDTINNNAKIYSK